MLIKLRSSGLCGSDFGRYRGDTANEHNGELRRPGHEPCGEIVALGPNVKGLKVGDRIIQHHYEGCRECEYCLTGWQQLCEVTEKKLTDVPTVPPLPVSEVVTIETLPKGAFIFRGQEKKRLGETPFAYTFKEGEEKVRLRIWADGYETAKMILRRQDISTTRRVSLKKSFVKKQKKKKLKKKKDAPIPTSLEGAID